jgi:hypothetical protein
VRPELRAKLALYQSKCAEVLADYFLGKRSTSDVLVSRVEALEVRLQAAEETRGVLSDWQRERIARDVQELSAALVTIKWKPSLSSASAWIQKRIEAWTEYGGTGATRAGMGADRYERVLMCLAQIERDIQDELERQGGGRQSIRTLKRNLQGKLFGAQPDGFKGGAK